MEWQPGVLWVEETARRKGPAVGFALVETPALRQQRGEPVELILSSGDRLHIGPGADGETVRLVLARLRPEHVQPDDLVFSTERGTPLNPSNVRNRVLIPACKAAGVPMMGWHNFRYTYSTWAEPTGESINALQSQLGHTDSRLTLSVYTQPMPEAQRQLASKIARVLLPVAPKLDPEEGSETEVIQ